jgi:uncharacterized protein (DUF433 family)
MPLSERIVVDSEVIAGKPVIRGTRLPVEFVLELLAAGQTDSEIMAYYPGLTRDDILACLSYASYLAHEFKARKFRGAVLSPSTHSKPLIEPGNQRNV